MSHDPALHREPDRPDGSRLWLRWLLGPLAAVPVVWLVADLTTNSAEPYAWDETVGRSLPAAGTVHRHRTEGFADTRIGAHGINGTPDVTALPGPAVALWGDSHLEGYALADRAKLAQQLTPLLPAPLASAYAVGLSGSTVAAPYFLIPRYEALGPPVALHVLVVTRLHYVLPGAPGDARFVATPEPAFVHQPRRPKASRQRWVAALHRWRATFVYRTLRAVPRELRFAPGRARTGTEARLAPGPPEERILAAWRLLARELPARASAPVLLAYAPTTPRLVRGEVLFDDPDAAAAAALEEIWTTAGHPFLHLGPGFDRLYRDRGHFPRGFANHLPDSGHLNLHGTRVLAETLASWLEAHPGIAAGP